VQTTSHALSQLHGFALSLFNLADGQLVTDASLIRLRFESMERNLGQSELRPALTIEDTYTVTGANLSIPADQVMRRIVMFLAFDRAPAEVSRSPLLQMNIHQQPVA
jgi:hypothetical protein